MVKIAVLHLYGCFWFFSPPDHPELDAQVSAQDPHRQGRREQRLRVQEHGILHARLPRDRLHRRHVLPEPQGHALALPPLPNQIRIQFVRILLDIYLSTQMSKSTPP